MSTRVTAAQAMLLAFVSMLPAAEVELANGLTGYWRFDGNGGDRSPLGNDLEIFGGAGFAEGLFGQALDLPGDPTRYAARPADDAVYDLGSGDFSISVWVNYHSTEGEQALIEKFTGPSGPGWTAAKLAGNAWHFFCGTLDQSVLATSEPVTITVGVWHHVLVRRAGAGFHLFFDGQYVAGADSSDPIPDTSFPLAIGERQGSLEMPLNGRIDEAAMWSRALSDAEITLLYDNGAGTQIDVPEPGPVTRRVPADYPTIQAGIDASSDGDTVLVAPGDYVTDAPITFLGKAIVVKAESPDGPGVTCIRMDLQPRDPARASVVVFDRSEGAASVLEGFTLTGGSGTYWSDPVYGSSSDGGGILCFRASPSIVNCAIRGNQARYGGGIAVCLGNARPTLAGCVVADNTCEESGGGLSSRWASFSLVGCTITGNAAQNDGGGYAAVGDGPSSFQDCVIAMNRARAGGGIFTRRQGLQLTNCTIAGNMSPDATQEVTSSSGGGVSCIAGAAFVNCTIVANTGCGIYSSTRSPALTSCIVWGNSGGALILRDAGGNPVTYSCIESATVWPGVGNINTDPGFGAWGSASDVFAATQEEFEAALEGFDLALASSSPCLGGGADGNDMGSATGACESAGAPFRTIHARAGVFSGHWLNLAWGVSIVGLGAETTTVAGTLYGLRSGARIAGVTLQGTGDGCVAVGSYEAAEFDEVMFTGCTSHEMRAVYCSYGSKGTFRSCTFSRNSCVSAVHGSYYSTLDFTACVFADNDARSIWAGKNSTFAMEESTITRNTRGGVTLDQTTASFKNCTIIENPGNGIIAYSRSSVTMSNCTLARNIGALSVESESVLTMTNCIVRDNVTASTGSGGLYVREARATLRNCTFSGNVGDLGGGAISDRSQVTLESCLFFDNSGGSLLHDLGDAPIVSFSCLEGAPVWLGEGNLNLDPRVAAWGAASEAAVASQAEFDAAVGEFSLALAPDSPCIGAGKDGVTMGADTGRCETAGSRTRLIRLAPGTYRTVMLNLAHHMSVAGSAAEEAVIEGAVFGLRGGATLSSLTVTGGRTGGITISAEESPTITDCVIAGNRTATNGGGVLCGVASTPKLVRCAITENEAMRAGGAMFCEGGSAPELVGCTIARNSSGVACASYYGPWMREFAPSTPLLIACTLSENGGSDGNALGAARSNPTLVNCLVIGNSGTGDGRAIKVSDGSVLTVTNCTIADNRGSPGGGIVCNGALALITNSIVWGNGAEPIVSLPIGVVAIRYSCVEGEGELPGIGNMRSDPLFVQLGSWNDNGTPDDLTDDVWTRGDYRLRPESPCIGAGTAEEAPRDDVDGNPRPCGPKVDIGAYELCDESLSPKILSLASASSAGCGCAHVFVHLTSDEPVEAFSLGVAHDPAFAGLIAMDFTGCPVIEALNGGQGPDYFGADLAPGTSNCLPAIAAGGTVYCIASRTQPSTATIPAGLDQPIVRLTYEEEPGNASGTQSPLAIVDCLGGDVPRDVVLTVENFSLEPNLVGGMLAFDAAACKFIRGDANSDGRVNIADAVTVLMYLFENGHGPLGCEDAADANDDGTLNIGDAIRILVRLFGAGTAFDPPYPGCGTDPTPDALSCSAGVCE